MLDQAPESIYNLIPREARAQYKTGRHLSKFKGNVRNAHNNNKAAYKTMGQANVPMRGPGDFLKKHEHEPQLPDRSDFHYATDERKKPSVPRRDEKPIMGLKTSKNFITQNAVENIMSVPKKPEHNFVDTKTGDKQPLQPSGMQPRYVNKKEFGKTPAYLVKRNDEMEAAQREYDQYISEHFRRGAMKQLSEQERQEILDGLKSNWELLHHEYQGLSVVTDTAPKKNRKERMEAEMKQLERDIETVEKHGSIYIANNPYTFC